MFPKNIHFLDSSQNLDLNLTLPRTYLQAFLPNELLTNSQPLSTCIIEAPSMASLRSLHELQSFCQYGRDPTKDHDILSVFRGPYQNSCLSVKKKGSHKNTFHYVSICLCLPITSCLMLPIAVQQSPTSNNSEHYAPPQSIGSGGLVGSLPLLKSINQ